MDAPQRPRRHTTRERERLSSWPSLRTKMIFSIRFGLRLSAVYHRRKVPYPTQRFLLRLGIEGAVLNLKGHQFDHRVGLARLDDPLRDEALKHGRRHRHSSKRHSVKIGG